jgi:hypothetical protein
MVHVIVHNLKPPFLDGRTVYTKQLEPINPIRDPTSDMAVFSKKGSALVKEKREQAERQKAAAKLASLGGTALGNVMGVRDEEADAEAAGTSFPFPFSLHPCFTELDLDIHQHFFECLLCLFLSGFQPRLQEGKGAGQIIKANRNLPPILRTPPQQAHSPVQEL